MILDDDARPDARRRSRADHRGRPDRARARLLPRVRRSSRCRRSPTGLDETIAAVGEIIEKSEPVNAIVDDINANLDAAVDALEGLLVKKAGMPDASRPRRRPLPGRGGRGLPQLPGQRHVKAPRISEVYTRGTLTLARLGREAPIAAASPDGGPVLRNVTGGSLAARGALSRPTRPGALADHRHRLARAVRGTRCRPQRRLSTSGRRASRARSPRCASTRTRAIIAGGHSLLPMMKLRLAQPAAPDRHQRPRRSSPTSARRATRSRSARSPATSTCSSPSCWPSTSRSSATPSR